MIENLPVYISLIFGLTTVVTLILFIRAMKNSNYERKHISVKILAGLVLWLMLQAILTKNNVYSSDINSFPPKILLFGILPPILSIVIIFITKRGRQFMDNFLLKNITYLNMVRIPVEMVLYWLFLNELVPGLMTFEGRNFDIIAGITAPIIAYFGFQKGKINRKIILLWNFIGLGLLLNIVVNAFLSAPSPIQQFAFEQPNIAILHFPFSWLPTFIVPVILLGHLVSIRQLLNRIEKEMTIKKITG